jgi:ubiquinone/menaquinone biosynthesis C-methylase UbiE
LSKENYTVTGIEREKEALDIIKHNYHFADNFKLVHGDIFEMSFPDKTFDMVISLGVLEHFEDMDLLRQAITEHKRILKDEGIFFVAAPFFSIIRLIFNVPFMKLVTFVRYLKKKKEYFAEYRYGKREFQKILETNGLKVMDVVYDDFLPPYNLGLYTDFPKLRSNNKDYMLNNLGNYIFKLAWNIHPSLVSGGIGFVCCKDIK